MVCIANFGRPAYLCALALILIIAIFVKIKKEVYDDTIHKDTEINCYLYKAKSVKTTNCMCSGKFDSRKAVNGYMGRD